MVLVYFVFVRLQKLVEKIDFDAGHIFSIWMKIHSLGHLNPAFSSFFDTKIMNLLCFLATSVTLWKNVPRQNIFSRRVFGAWQNQNILGPSTLQALSIYHLYFVSCRDIFSQKSRRRCQQFITFYNTFNQNHENFIKIFYVSKFLLCTSFLFILKLLIFRRASKVTHQIYF